MVEQITYRRVYEESSPADGKRVLVDRVWPRGMRKEDAHLDEWLRYIAPSSDLRTWYAHEPSHRQAAEHLRDLAAHDRLTLLTATRDVDRSQAAVLAEWPAGKR
ncbi:DUF488 family protein [Streptomyces hygroscopicus subsp. hygroscopicus]|uniref:DUF488 domain-containing protein n=1 Tax=Streptomyces hygroscopicus TaxID=1912 RepID=UPI001C655FCB|nr:DUF488 family protein [Streptomyces hygroscopicus]MBW8090954.1 DUF488 family protein [Streptomyces hygroscopicus subsp. hygroscopicus]